MQKGFLFDLNKCTGCQACLLACTIENQVTLPINWRRVETFNDLHVPGEANYHLSLACNHCIDPPCLNQCPTRAYTKDEQTGAVLLDAQRCIGCNYCAWICPYNVPQYNQSAGVMEKCTFCNHLLQQGENPACVSLCPTTALQCADFDKQNTALQIPGFPQSNAMPAITFVPLQENRRMPETTTPVAKDVVDDFLIDYLAPKIQKITLKKEWSLAVFSLLTSILVGLIAASLFAADVVHPLFFITALLFCGGVSLLHLGRKRGAYRAIINWRSSRLSREILFYSLFFVCSIPYLVFFPSNFTIGLITTLSGFSALLAIDQVYRFKGWYIHSADVWLTGILFLGLFAGVPSFVLAAGAFKLLIYLWRKYQFFRQNKPIHFSASFARILLGFLIPTVIWSFTQVGLFLIVGSVIFAELIDRCEFYLELNRSFKIEGR